jgi:site-specific recombinase XerD
VNVKVTEPNFASLLQRFFTERLIQQKNASPKTVSSYRDTFRLFLQFAQRRLRKPCTRIELTDLDTSLVSAFLDHLEADRHNTIRSRNTRFAALRSFFKYAGLMAPTALGTIRGVMAMPMKRFERRLVGYFSREEVEALLNAPNPATWCGQRDRVLLATLYNTGARVSELICMRVGDVVLDRGPSVCIHGKGRKERTVPLWPRTAKQIRFWLRQNPLPRDRPLFPNRTGGPMTRTGVTDRLKLAATTAARRCPQLKKRPISPHVVRHSTAMHMLQSGVDITVIALWLGHESPATTHMYVEADLNMKERALKTLQAPSVKTRRFQPTDQLLAFLEGL